jgi:hypothetical protein
VLTLGIVGNVATVTATFTQSGVVTDPAGTITFTIRVADSPTLIVEVYPTAPAIVKDAVGIYHRNYVCAAAGEFACNVAAGAGNGQAAEDAIWEIAPSALYT